MGGSRGKEEKERGKQKEGRERGRWQSGIDKEEGGILKAWERVNKGK